MRSYETNKNIITNDVLYQLSYCGFPRNFKSLGAVEFRSQGS
jgi:hypothetical protein